MRKKRNKKNWRRNEQNVEVPTDYNDEKLRNDGKQTKKHFYKMKPKLMQIMYSLRQYFFPYSIGPIVIGRNYLFYFLFWNWRVHIPFIWMNRQQNGKMRFQNSLWLRWCDKCVTSGIHYSQFTTKTTEHFPLWIIIRIVAMSTTTFSSILFSIVILYYFISTFVPRPGPGNDHLWKMSRTITINVSK